MNFIRCCVIAALFMSCVARGDADVAIVSPRMNVFEFASRFTVKVVSNYAHLFTARPWHVHGSGFLVGVKKGADRKARGVVFTNRHVIQAPSELMARSITIQFESDTDVPESVEAEVVYESSLNDFAVLEFKMEDLHRVRDRIQPAPMPPMESTLRNFSENYRSLQGREVWAQGNPLDNDSVTTYGNITGRTSHFMTGDFILTQTPINPGNSGGPLIDLQSRFVIGMNTKKMKDADNVGYAIPIAVLLEEYASWLLNPDVARIRGLDVRWAFESGDELDVMGIKGLIASQSPDFFQRFEGALRVDDVDPATGLRTGDVVIKINGVNVSPNIYLIRKTIQLSEKNHFDFQVVRNGQFVNVPVPIADSTYRDLRHKVDFVYISGMLFREADVHYYSRHVPSSVILDLKLGSSELTFGARRMPDQNSRVTGIIIENQEYQIRFLADLKRVLTEHPTAKFMRLVVREPLTVESQSSGSIPVGDIFHNIQYQPSTATYVVPLMETIVPSQFSIHRFARQFSFSQSHPETRDWRRFVKPGRTCATNLAAD